MEMFNDILHNVKFTLAKIPKIYTADQNGTSADVKDFRLNGVLFVLGDSGDTLSGSVLINLKLQDSADNSTFADVAAADVLAKDVDGTSKYVNPVIVDDPADDEKSYFLEYKGGKRYFRGVADFVGTHTNGTEVGIVNVQASPSNAPVTQGT